MLDRREHLQCARHGLETGVGRRLLSKWRHRQREWENKDERRRSLLVLPLVNSPTAIRLMSKAGSIHRISCSIDRPSPLSNTTRVQGLYSEHTRRLIRRKCNIPFQIDRSRVGLKAKGKAEEGKKKGTQQGENGSREWREETLRSIQLHATSSGGRFRHSVPLLLRCNTYIVFRCRRMSILDVILGSTR